jgi:4-hydroxy-2-oxoheptanedioate aldolase
MERNRLKKKLLRGELGTISGNYETSDMIDFVGSLDLFDAAWIDMEHSPVTWANLADFSRAADIWGMSSIVRIRDNDPSMIALALAEGVDGVLIPHVNSKAEAEQVVDAAKFAPIGHRGMSGGRRSYGRADHYVKANEETFVGVLIEDVAAVEQITDILEVPEIDVFFVARYDLSQSMGFAGEPKHPDVVAMTDRALEAIVAAGRVAGAGGGPADLDKYLEMGVTFLKVPDWRAWITAGANDYKRTLDAAVSATGAPR